jgi:predicted porin
MKTRISMLALAGLASAGAQAQTLNIASNFEIYGRVHVSYDMLDNGDNYSRATLSSNATRFGVRGNKDFGGLKGVWQIEQEIFPLNNSTDNRFATRDTFAGIQSGFGLVRVGRYDSPAKIAREPFNLFGDQLGDMRNLTRVGNAKFDERPSNLIEYQSPKMGSFTGRVAYSPHQTTQGEVDANQSDVKDDMQSAMLTYANSGLVVNASFEKWNGLAGSTSRRDTTRLAASYDLSKATKLVAYVEDQSYFSAANVAASAKVNGLGVQQALSPKTFLNVTWLSRDESAADADATMTAIGLEHRLDRQLRIYANYAQVDNQSKAKLLPWVQGRSTASGTSAVGAGVNGKDSSGFSFGVRYDF